MKCTVWILALFPLAVAEQQPAAGPAMFAGAGLNADATGGRPADIADAAHAQTSLASGAGAVVRPQDGNDADLVSVLDYCAVAFTDKRDCIQRALDSLPAAGGAVFIPAGVYLVRPAANGDAGIFSVRSNTTIYGTGQSSVIKVMDNAGDYGAVFRNATSPVENISFHDFTIDQNPAGNRTADIRDRGTNSNGAAGGYKQDSIWMWTIHNLSVDRMTFAECTGVNTVSAGGDDGGTGHTSTNLSVRNSYFRFNMGRTLEMQGDGTYYYDNSAVYLEGSQQAVSNNVFETTLADNAFGAIETHGGRSSITGNTARYFETLVNVVSSAYDVTPNNITVSGNSVSGAKLAITLWPALGKDLKNIVIADNAIEIANAERAAHAYRHNNDMSWGIGSRWGDGGAIDGLIISNNTISSQLENRNIASQGEEALNGGIAIQNLGPTRNFLISQNVIIDAPKSGISVWGVTRGSQIGTVERGLISGNVLVDAGQNNIGSGAYRSAITLAGLFKHVDITGNKIVDTGAPSLVGVRSIVYYSTASGIQAVRIWDNHTTSYSGRPLVKQIVNDPEVTYRDVGEGTAPNGATVTCAGGQRLNITAVSNGVVTAATCIP